MFNKCLFILSALCVILISPLIKPEGILLSWSPNNIKFLTQERFLAASKMSSQEIIQNNLTAKTWCDAYLLLIVSTQHKDDSLFLKSLIQQITNHQETKLEGTSRLIIWERIISGEILFEGKGYQVDDDLFSVAGRANWILKNITKHCFGVVMNNSTPGDLEILKAKWNNWQKGIAEKEYSNPYEKTKIATITSLHAIEALIISLKPNKEKDRLTRNCLKDLYNLDELPKDSNSVAKLCNPDVYTYGWLAVLTGIENMKSYSDWNDWWAKNHNSLSWNKEKQIFEAKAN